jgi:hypothetical protein
MGNRTNAYEQHFNVGGGVKVVENRRFEIP